MASDPLLENVYSFCLGMFLGKLFYLSVIFTKKEYSKLFDGQWFKFMVLHVAFLRIKC